MEHYDVDFFCIMMQYNSMDGLRVLEVVKKINPWLKNGVVPEAQLEPFKRREFHRLEKDLDQLDMMTLIIGARRVGKSVLMYQLIDSLLQKGVDPKRILFIQGDNTLLTEFAVAGNLITFILDLYQKYILDKNFDDIAEPVYVFLDEAQSLKSWDREIKTIIDQKYKIKFVVTGSSSFELRRGSENPLTGRVVFQPISPFSFADYVLYNIEKDKKPNFESALQKLSDSFRGSLLEGDIKSVFSAAKKAEALVAKHDLNNKFENYLYYGGFPRVVTNRDKDHTRYLRDLLTSTVSKDIQSNVEVRDPQTLERLMVNLCLMAGTITRYKKFSDILGVEERTIIKYIDYYVETHWAFISSPHIFSKRPDSVSTDKKFYVIDSGVLNTLAFKDIDEFKSDRAHLGNVLENVIHNHLLAFKQETMGTFQNTVSFWIEDETNKEIDFIFEIKGGVLPVEVKQKVSYDSSDEGALTDFLAKRSTAKFGILTTKDTLEIKDKKLLLIPGVIFTLLL